MFWIAILFALLLSLGALAYVVWPLLKSGPAPVLVEDDRLTELLSRKDAVMMAIKELEFDYHVGKLSAEDYQLYDQRLRRQAIGLMQQIEQVAPESSSLEESLEAEIARYRKVREQPPAALAVPESRPQPATRPASAPSTNGLTATQARFCTNCGGPVEAQHKFCANCGAPVVAPAAVQA